MGRGSRLLTADIPALHPLPVVGVAINRVSHSFFVAKLASSCGPTKLHDARCTKCHLIHPLSLQGCRGTMMVLKNSMAFLLYIDCLIPILRLTRAS